MRDIEVYRRWLEEGALRRIVFSGWSSDLAANQDIFDALVEMGVQVVLSPEPNFVVHGYIYHQMKTLHFGLSMFEDDELVIKSRTDNAWLNFHPLTLTRLLDEAAPVGPNSPFESRIAILCGLAFQPFFFNDMMYAGRVSDLRRLVSFDLWFDAEGALINAEQALHTAPVLASRPYLRDYFLANPGLQHGRPDVAGRLQRAMLADSFYLRCVWDSLSVIRDGYIVGFHDPTPFVPPSIPVTLEDLADDQSKDPVPAVRYLAAASTAEFYNNAAVEFLLSIPVSAAEPRSLRDLFENEPAPARQRPLLSGAPANFARALAEAMPELALPKPPPERALIVHHQRMPYVRIP